jgi:hypothetical protein
MFEGTGDSVFNIKSVFGLNISYKSFKIENLPMQNSYCDDTNFDNVNQALLINIPRFYTRIFKHFLFSRAISNDSSRHKMVYISSTEVSK